MRRKRNQGSCNRAANQSKAGFGGMFDTLVENLEENKTLQLARNDHG